MMASPLCRRAAAIPMMVRMISRMSEIYSTAPCWRDRAEQLKVCRICRLMACCSVDRVANVDGGVEHLARAVVSGDGDRVADHVVRRRHRDWLVARGACHQQRELDADDIDGADLIGRYVRGRSLTAGRIDAVEHLHVLHVGHQLLGRHGLQGRRETRTVYLLEPKQRGVAVGADSE